MGIIHAAGTDETYGTYVDDECFDIHDYDDDTDQDRCPPSRTIPGATS